MRGAKMSPNATKVLSRIEALRSAAKAGVLSSEEAGAARGPRPSPWGAHGDPMGFLALKMVPKIGWWCEEMAP